MFQNCLPRIEEKDINPSSPSSHEWLCGHSLPTLLSCTYLSTDQVVQVFPAIRSEEPQIRKEEVCSAGQPEAFNNCTVV